MATKNRITNKQTAPSKGVVSKPQSAIANMAATVASTPQAAPVASKPQTVALRGGIAVTNIALTGTPYRVGAPHNAVMWAYLQKQLEKGPVAVSSVLQTPTNTAGVPGHFVGYALRRGYLKAVA